MIDELLKSLEAALQAAQARADAGPEELEAAKAAEEAALAAFKDELETAMQAGMALLEDFLGNISAELDKIRPPPAQ